MRWAAWVVLAVAASWAAAAPPANSSKTLVVGDAAVVIDWTPGWEVDTNAAGLPAASAAFRTTDATKMQALLSTRPLRDEFRTDEGINTIVRDMAVKLESQSVEKKIEVQRIAGPVARGYYVCATDRAPKPAEYKYMCQGLISLAETPIVFTILYNDPGKPDADKVIAAMKTVRIQ